jgi:transposase
MATERLSMQKLREILRQKWGLGRSHREAAMCLSLSAGSVANAIERAGAAGLDWPKVQALSDAELEAKLYAERPKMGEARPMPDPLYLHDEYQKVGVTLELLHQEYLEQYPGGYRYSQFCAVYRDWLKKRRLSMRQVHRGGEKLFIDYSGKKPNIVSPLTGEVTPVELFVCALGASSYTFAEATLTQKVADFIQSHVHAFAYFEGVAGALVPDQLKSAVTYGGQSRKQRYLKVDKPALKPLPSQPFVLAEHKWVKANIDYHIDFGDHHYYSVPSTLRDEKLEARFSQTTVEVFFKGERVASHRRSFEVGRHSTKSEHMPKAHREHLEWSPSRILGWGRSIGPNTALLLETIMNERKHPEQGYRTCLGILRQEKLYDKARLEAACTRALALKARSYRHVASILKNGLDRLPLPLPKTASTPTTHDNIRGAAYYAGDDATEKKDHHHAD